MGYVSQCRQCGQEDDHPKVVAGTLGGVNDDVETTIYHHDCLPYDLKQQLQQNEDAAAIIEACESGLKGDELRSHIVSLRGDGTQQEVK